MKKTGIILVCVLFLTGFKSYGQIDNLSNLSTEWIRLSARNAATDAADIVVYNPAGLTHLEDGFHINAGNQFVFRKPSHKYDIGMGEGQKSFEQQSSDPFLPNLYMSYKKDKWAIFTGAFISGGGATIDYSQGSITTDLVGMQALANAQGAYMMTKDPSFTASSYYLTTTLGGTYAINQILSVAYAIRYLNASNSMQAGMTLTNSPVDMPDMPLAVDADFNAEGFGHVFSACLKPVDKLTLSARYETRVKLDFETSTHHDDFGATVNEEMNRRDLPSVLAFGVGYVINDRVKIYGDYNVYNQEAADWGKSSMLTDEKPMSELAGNAKAYGAGMEYKLGEKMNVSCGMGYTQFDYNNKEGYYSSLGTFEVAPDDNLNFNCGFVFKPITCLAINAGFMHVFYKKDQHVNALMAYPMNVDVTVNNSISIFSAGVNLSF